MNSETRNVRLRTTALIISSCVAALVCFSPMVSAGNDEGAEEKLLSQRRAAYADAVAEEAKTERPESKDPNFRDKLSLWSTAHDNVTRTMHDLIPALLNHWKSLPNDSPNMEALEAEIAAIHQQALHPPRSERSHKESQFFAGTIWPIVASSEISARNAAFLAQLTRPHRGIRQYDQIASTGLPTEPYGWDIQMTHTIALLRAGQVDAARTESDALLKKLNVNLTRGRLPGVKLNFRDGKRSTRSLKRESLLHRALIEATAGEREHANSWMKQAMEIVETDSILESQRSLIEELHTLLQR